MVVQSLMQKYPKVDAKLFIGEYTCEFTITLNRPTVISAECQPDV